MAIAPGRRPLLRELFFKPHETRENLDTIIEGFIGAFDNEDRTQMADRFIVEEAFHII
jgi:hypothetical protein